MRAPRLWAAYDGTRTRRKQRRVRVKRNAIRRALQRKLGRSSRSISKSAGAMYHGLDGHPIDLARWAYLFEVHRLLRRTRIGDDALVSTIYTGTAVALDDKWRPLIYETMLIRRARTADNKPAERYGPAWQHATRDEALACHEQLVAKLHRAARIVARCAAARAGSER